MQRLIQVRLDWSNALVERMKHMVQRHRCIATELAGSDAELLTLDKSQEWQGAFQASSHVLGLPTRAIHVQRFASGHLADPDRSVRQMARNRLAGLIELAARLGATRLSMAPAAVAMEHVQRVDYSAALNHTAAALQRILPVAERSGIQLCVRASFEGFLVSPPELRELIGALTTHAVGVDLDLTHRSDRAHWRDWLATLSPYIAAIGAEIQDDLDVDATVEGLQGAVDGTPLDAHLVLRTY